MRQINKDLVLPSWAQLDLLPGKYVTIVPSATGSYSRSNHHLDTKPSLIQPQISDSTSFPPSS